MVVTAKKLIRSSKASLTLQALCSTLLQLVIWLSHRKTKLTQIKAIVEVSA